MSSEQAVNERVENIARRLAELPGAMLPVLHEVQAEFGYIPKHSVPVIAEVLRLSRAEVHGVISFYHDFHTEPEGKTAIHVCRAEACQAMGSRDLETHVKDRLGVDFGGTTEDGRYTLKEVYCLGNCACSPSIRIDNEIHARVTPERFDQLLSGSD